MVSARELRPSSGRARALEILLREGGVIQMTWTAVDGGWLGEWLGEWLQECRWDDWESDWGMIGRVIGRVAGFFCTALTAVDGTDDGQRIAIPASL